MPSFEDDEESSLTKKSVDPNTQINLRREMEEEDVSIHSLGVNCENMYPTTNKNATRKNDENKVDDPKVGMIFNTTEEAYLFYSSYGKQNGFAVSTRTSRKGSDRKLQNVTLQCTRGGKARVRTTNPVRPRPQIKIGCKASLNLCLCLDGRWMLNRLVLEHNHETSPGKTRYYKCNRVLEEHVKRRFELNDDAGIRVNKSYRSLVIQSGGHPNAPYTEKDCRNYLDKRRRLRLGEGDANAMHEYFMKMKADNSEFFYAMDLDDKFRLRNVFWADARSRAACKEFGDVVTFDTTYLVNKYDIPFTPFVSVNHHGQSILLGCGLISHEDTSAFSWLFRTWITCMWGNSPNAIITDQDKAMKKAIEIEFPNTRHRWCLWHILKKVPEKLSGYDEYKSIKTCLHKAVYDSLTKEEFEGSWSMFIEKYKLQSNKWLLGLYEERNRWVPTFVKDVFWDGMSTTQRSESMNSYFDGYINSRTTLKQFVDQYENALAKRVESEGSEDFTSWNSYIPCITESKLEKLFQSHYTIAKFKEFHKEFVGKLDCSLSTIKLGNHFSEYNIKEDISFGEGDHRFKKRVSFIVHFKQDSNEANCNCRLFEFKGILCRHQLMVFHERGIEQVPHKYILRRWSELVKRVNAKVRINYDKSSNAIGARRYDNMCNFFTEVADLAQDFPERYDIVMAQLHELKEGFKEPLDVGGSNGEEPIVVSSTFGDEVLPSKESINILDPLVRRRKGRPPFKRKQGIVEKCVMKAGNKKRKEAKEIEEAVQIHNTQESVIVDGCRSNFTRQPNTIQEESIPFMHGIFSVGTDMNYFINNMTTLQDTISSYGSQAWKAESPSFMEMLTRKECDED